MGRSEYQLVGPCGPDPRLAIHSGPEACSRLAAVGGRLRIDDRLWRTRLERSRARAVAPFLTETTRISPVAAVRARSRASRLGLALALLPVAAWSAAFGALLQ
jgi:hypothetical protein